MHDVWILRCIYRIQILHQVILYAVQLSSASSGHLYCLYSARCIWLMEHGLTASFSFHVACQASEYPCVLRWRLSVHPVQLTMWHFTCPYLQPAGTYSTSVEQWYSDRCGSVGIYVHFLSAFATVVQYSTVRLLRPDESTVVGHHVHI